MSECIVCEEKTEGDYTLCLACINKRNVVTIGIKSPSYYINKIITLGNHHNTIVVKCLWHKIEIVNRIIKPTLFYWGLEEIRRKSGEEKGKDRKLEVFYITFEMISPLKALKTDARRKGLF
jgi:hypothetical protein|tara:strand:- start:1294 stop:1656 length:363 start_codon:yes stop_codon:yes gene_type:complete